MFKGLSQWLDDCDRKAAAKRKVKRVEWLKNRDRELEIELAKDRAQLEELAKWFNVDKSGKSTRSKSQYSIEQEAKLKASIAGAEKELELNKKELEELA